MKNSSAYLFFLITSITVFGQNSPFWGNLDAGGFRVGYNDTVIYNTGQSYTFNGYQGNKPYFVSMWSPSQTITTDPTMLYSDYLIQHLPDVLKTLEDSLVQMQRTSIINYGIKNRVDSWDDRAYGDPEKQLFTKMFGTQVNATKSTERTAIKCPVVVYHHGMGGTREENSVLFEYLASNGFFVISSNYHWPSQSTRLADLVDDLRIVTDFATMLPNADEDNMYFLGHSWGAQMGLFLNQSGDHPYKSFVLLDNTLEPLTIEQVGRYYPELDSLFQNHSNDFRTKTYVVTSQKTYIENGEFVTTPEPKFEPFKRLGTENFEFLVTNQSLSHEAFTSNGVIRNVFQEQIAMDDSASLSAQFETYLELNRELLKFFKDGKFDTSIFFREVELK